MTRRSSQIADVVAPTSEDPKLIIIRVITFELTQHTPPTVSQRHRRTDGQAYRRTVLTIAMQC